MASDSRRWGLSEAAFLFGCAAFLYLHLFTIFPTGTIFYEEDHLYFMHDAWRMFRGEALYRDFFEYTFPGTQVLYLGLLHVFGEKFWLINAVILVQGLGITAIGLAISTHLFNRCWLAFLGPSLFLFFGFRWFGIDGSHRMLSPVFLMLAILVLLKGRTVTRLGLAGAACALASYFTQQRGVLAVIAMVLFLAVEHYRHRSGWRTLARDVVVLGGSFAVTLTLLVLPFLVSAGPGTFLDYTVLYIRNYVQHPTANYGAYGRFFTQVLGQGALMSAVMLFYYALIPLVYLVGLLYMWRRKYDAGILLITLVGLMLALGTFAPSPARLFQVSMPALILLAWLVSQMRPAATVIRVAVIGLAIAGGALAFRLQMAWEPHILDSPTGRLVFLSPVYLERYEWLRQHARQGEDVFEVYMPAVNFALQLPNPTQVPFLLDYGYTPMWQVERAIENLRHRQPRFIIWDGTWSKAPAERTADDNLSPLYDYLKTHYELRQAFTPYANRRMEAWQIRRR